MFEELNKKSPAARMADTVPEFRSKSQALLFSLMYYRCDHINPDGQFIRAINLYELILEQIPSLMETDILITPKNTEEEIKETVDHIFHRLDITDDMPVDKGEPEQENVCQGCSCGEPDCEGCDEVPEDRLPEYEHKRETPVTSDSGSDV